MNRQLAIFATIIGLAILVVAAVWGVRTLALNPANPVVITILYSTEKEGWLKEVVSNFEATHPTLSGGRPIQLQLKSMGSREMYLGVLDGSEKPDVMSPAGTLQISMLQELSTSKFGSPVVKANDPSVCRPVLNTPLVLVAWKDRADALFGAKPSGDLWKRLHDAATDPKGWAAYGHPEWGYFKFSHTSPLKSNSGLMAILLMTYDYYGKTSGLTSADILANRDYQKWFLEMEGAISQFGDSTGTYMKDIVAYGPSMYDMVAVYESSVIGQADNARGRYGELHVYYPPTTVMSDHPFCVLNADWVTPEKKEAGKVFVDYLLGKTAQQLALTKYGFRPADTSIPLDGPDSPFTRYAANGLSIGLPGPVQLPSGDVLNTLTDFWSRNEQR